MLGEIAQLSRADDEFEAVFVSGSGVERRVPWRWLPGGGRRTGTAGEVVPIGSQLIWREFSHMWRGSSSEVAEAVEPQFHVLQSRRFGCLCPQNPPDRVRRG